MEYASRRSRRPCAPNAPSMTAAPSVMAAVAVQFMGPFNSKRYTGPMFKLATLLLAAVCAFAQPASSKLPKVTFTDTTLPNGLRVIISEDRYAPIYAIAISYKVGSRDERKGRTGF